MGVRRGWSTPSSGKKRGRPTGARSPVLKVKWMAGRDGGATAICASGGGGPQCGPADARGGAGGTFAGSLELLLFPGKVGGVQKKIRECNLPNRSGSCHLDHRVGDFSSPGIRRYGYLRPKLDCPGQVYCGPTELWAATSPRQCSSGYANLGDSGSLPGVGESFGTEEGSSPGTDLDRGHSGVSGDSRESTLFRENSLRTVGCPEVESRIPVPVASVVQSDIVGPREAGSG